MARAKFSPEALALICLRSERGWSQKKLASELGFSDERQLSRYERGEKALSRENLESLAAPLGYSPEAIDTLLFAFRLAFPQAPEEAASPVAPSPEERARIARAAMTGGWAMAAEIGTDLTRQKREQKAEAARREAQELWQRLRRATREERRDLVAVFPEFRTWALAVQVCEASVRAAAHKVEEALELADLALFIAERTTGEESWRCRLKGFVWAHVGNARRVANGFSRADEAFARAWDYWRAGADSDPTLLPEWRLFDLEASLRRAERRFPEALELLERARAASREDPLAAGRLLLSKEHVFDQMGDTHGALSALTEAAPFVEASRDLRLIFALRFNMADNLCHLERHSEAADLLPRVRELAVQAGNELDLIRVLWLEARVAAGQGRKEEARTRLEQVRRDFSARELPYDAALSSLDLAVLCLDQGGTGNVRTLALAMAWIFRAQGIHREALAALSLFYEAAQQETATIELTRRVIFEIERVRRSASHPGK
jgi:transcriptional regulator with XRE-family HTH domain